MRKGLKASIIFLGNMVAFLLGVDLYAQNDKEQNAYYEVFSEQINGRYYFSRKYTALKIKDDRENKDYLFMPNSTLNMGVGATYKNLTLNLAYGFGFLNPERGRGDTKYLDLQAHVYPKKMVIDLFGQFYRGYYLLPRGLGAGPGEEYFLRPDLKIRKIGASVQYLFNGEKFSFRAAFQQNEWQKRSAGTFLLGFEMYGGQAEDEDYLLPVDVLTDENRNIKTIRFFEFGPNLGYAYTLVIKKHFFVTASASSNLGTGYTAFRKEDEFENRWAIRPNLFLRGFVGYNSKTWSINANYVHNNVRLAPNNDFSPEIRTGNYRLNFIYRFLPGPKLSSYLRYVDIVSPI